MVALYTSRETEARLGFNTSNALARTKGVRKIPILDDLLTGLTGIAVRYVSYNTPQIRNSQGIRRKAIELFEKLGPELWPGPNEPHPSWLYLASRDGEHPCSKLFPERLFFSRPEDHEILQNRFIDLVIGKACRYHYTHSNNQPLPGEPPESDCLPNSEESEAPGSRSFLSTEESSDDERDDTSSISNYSNPASRRKRVTSQKKASRSSGYKAMQQFGASSAPKSPHMGNAQATLASLSNDDLTMQRQADTPNTISNNHQTPFLPTTTSKLDTSQTTLSTGAHDITPRFQEKRRRKRPIRLEDCSTGSKRSRTEDVSNPFPLRPSLIVVIKLTRGKGQASEDATRASCNASDHYSPSSIPILTSFLTSAPGLSRHSVSLHSGSQINTSSAPVATHGENENTQGDDGPSVLGQDSNTLQSTRSPVYEIPLPTKVVSFSDPSTSSTRGDPRVRHDNQQSNQPVGKPPAQAPDVGLDLHNAICDARTIESIVGEPSKAQQTKHDTVVQNGSAQQSPTDNQEVNEKETRGVGNAQASTPPHSPSSAIWLDLYISDEEDVIGWVELTQTATREELFAAIEEELKLQRGLSAAQTVSMVKITRHDGQKIRGTRYLAFPIQKHGHGGTWAFSTLKKRMSENGAGSVGETALKGQVRVENKMDGKY